MRVELSGVTKSFHVPGGEVRAVDGVSARVAAGEAVAVVGANGAGKSTLLRVVAGIVSPTSGTVRRSRRCGSLIDLGTGFHPDLTGRENLALGLALAGLSPRERTRVLPEALDFTGLGDAVDLPVKRLSTGMVARVACASVVFTSPDLLLVDEVLAVGDASFHRRMLSTISTLTADGAALLLVTHSPELAAVATTRTIWLDSGSVVEDGPTEVVLERYESAVRGWGRSFETGTVRIAHVDVDPRTVEPGAGAVVEVDIDVVRPTGPVEMRVEFRPVIGDEPWMRSSEDSLETWHLNLVAATSPVRLEGLGVGRHRAELHIGAIPITPSDVELSVLLADERNLVIDEVTLGMRIGGGALRPMYHLVAEVEPLARP